MNSNRASLFNLLNKHFNDEELQTLCFVMRIDYDSLTGQGKSGKIRELISLCERVGRIEDLEFSIQQTQSDRESYQHSQKNDASNNLEVNVLLQKVQSQSSPLSECITQALALAKRKSRTSLEYFCRNELLGWSVSDIESIPRHRLITWFFSPIKLDLLRYTGRVEDLFMALQTHEYFGEIQYPVLEPISDIEERLRSMSDNMIMTRTSCLGDMKPDAEQPDTKIHMYSNPRDLGYLINSIRRKLTEELCEL